MGGRGRQGGAIRSGPLCCAAGSGKRAGLRLFRAAKGRDRGREFV